MFSRPALADLISRTRADILSRLKEDDPLRREDAEVHARVHGGSANAMYGYLDWMFRQLFPDTAEKEYLDRWASIWLPTPRIPAQYASGSLSCTIQPGALLPAGTQWQFYDGMVVESTADATIAGTTATAPIRALVAGAAANRAAGQTLTLVSPLAGVATSALAGAISGGSEQETDASLQTRLLARIQEAPHGGAWFDYVAWALEVPGTTRAWVYPGEMGVGTVSLRFMRDNDINPIPDAAAVSAMQAYIDARRPLGMGGFYAAAPIANPQNFSIALTPNTTTVRGAVQTALADLIRREATPGGQMIDPATGALATGGTTLLSHYNEAISLAAGETDHTLSVPSANVTNSAGYITTLGTITWL